MPDPNSAVGVHTSESIVLGQSSLRGGVRGGVREGVRKGRRGGVRKGRRGGVREGVRGEGGEEGGEE